MKTKSLLTILLIFTSITFFAQKNNFGVKGGVNLSNQNASIDVPNLPVTITTIGISSFHLGVFGEINLSEKSSILTEVLYTREGSMVNLQAIAFEQKVDYIKIPILYSHNIFTDNLSVHFGPQFGYLVKDYVEFDNNDGDPFTDADFKSFEFSTVLGAEYKINKKLKVGARYNLGITDISNTDEGSFKNRNLQFYVGFQIF